ncbi:MAG: M23 family metallopeptidase, partial [Burkholderiales bacterium]|nr:M23 family metallopeptidase [Burkholderiales bacterium]
MLISPPFLPTKQENQTDENWLNLAMSGACPGDGFFPISFDLGWHGGMHLKAPLNGNVSQRVRAIADGTVVFKRAPNARQDDVKHPQNYRGGWTDNGCIVIRHDTAIGDGQNAAAVSFFSIYMHLSELHPSIKDGRRIYRKDDLGQAGQIYGDINRKIHFELVCDDANLRKLVGRVGDDVN